MSAPHKQQRVTLYGRVSDDRSRESKSVDQQLAEGRTRAERIGRRIVGEFRDDSISASRYARGKNRPGWQQAMDQITAGETDILDVWEISRPSRDRMVFAALFAACQDSGVLVDIGGQVRDPNDPEDAFMLDLGAALAVRESGVTSKRVRRDVLARANEGRPHGRLPYGYRAVYDPVSGAPAGRVPDEKAAPIVREIVRRMLGGESNYVIAHDLQQRGVPSPHAYRLARQGSDATPRPWSIEQVGRIAVNPTYAGFRTHKGVVLGEGTWEPIISPTEHQAILARFADPRRRRWGGENRARYLLSGIARCGVCGSPVRRLLNRGVPSYSCFGADRRGRTCVSRLQEPVDALVTATLIAWVQRPTTLAELLALTDDDAAADAGRELAELHAKLAEFEESAARPGGITAAAFGRIEARLLEQIADARRRALPVGVPALVLDFASAADPAGYWAERLGIGARRQIVRYLLDVRIHRSLHRLGVRGFDPDLIEIVPRLSRAADGR